MLCLAVRRRVASSTVRSSSSSLLLLSSSLSSLSFARALLLSSSSSPSSPSPSPSSCAFVRSPMPTTTPLLTATRCRTSSPLLVGARRHFAHTPSEEAFDSDADYHRVADATLDHIAEQLEPLEDELLEGFDLEFGGGVIDLTVGSVGFVINKQTPNRQIWWSSSLSGPKRFYYERSIGEWRCTRDESLRLERLLDAELRSLDIVLDKLLV